VPLSAAVMKSAESLRRRDAVAVGNSTSPQESEFVETSRSIRLLKAVGCPLPDIDQVWRRTEGDPRVCIAILDGPVDLSHPSLRGARLTALGASGTSCYGGAACLHGTHVASLVFAQHGEGPLKGVAPHCRGIVIPVFSDDPALQGAIRPCAQSVLARAIEAAVGYGARVINISAGQPGHAGTADARLLGAVELCARRGVLIVAAAGNDGCDCLHLPAALPTVLTVGAHGADGAPTDSSNFGGAYQHQGIVAPGVSILGAAVGGQYERRTGTSFAAPLVAGLAGLLLSAKLARRGHFTASDAREVREALLQSAAPCNLDDRRECRRLLAGRVVPLRAFDLYLKGAIDMDQMATKAPSALRADPVAPTELTETVTPAGAGMRSSSGGCDKPSSELTGKPLSDYDSEKDDESSQAGADQPRTRPKRILLGTSTRTLAPSECGCQQGGGLVYALGMLNYDFGSQARFDAIDAEMDVGKFATNPQDLWEFLTKEGRANLHFASAILWTLNHEGPAPFYALRPEGAFAKETYVRLLEFFGDQINGKAERVSVPGVLDGSVTLSSGQQLPVVIPDLRALFNWKTADLITAVAGKKPATEPQKREYEMKIEGMRNFLERIYFELRNNGQTPQERALNFAGTNAFQLEAVFKREAARHAQLDEIRVEASPICRPDSDCWDVLLIFFNPQNVLAEAREAVRFTVDVSDVVPVMVGEMRTWAVR